MRLIISSLALAVVVGYLAGGRLGLLAQLEIRWPYVALAGLGLQVAPVPGPTLPLVLLLVSFVLLIAFAAVNVRARVVGFPLILIGIALNFVVIAVNQGMPVSREALVASGQAETLSLLARDGGVKHHLVGPDDRLLFLGDVIVIRPLSMVASVGDLIAYAGVLWLVLMSMVGQVARVRPRPIPVGVTSDAIRSLQHVR
ncbi:MAG: DUF5317 family protein [Actinomycetota bacterium]